ncbi:hypothetical protein ACCD10_21470 [Pseudomonas sp. Pseusp122]|uniref:hypothetical protein n=1 Tax=unclassified Pseudomonas TaxID=196821 RepID=UPI0039A58C36
MPYELNTIRHDLQVTALDLERVKTAMAGHFEYLRHTIHQHDAVEVLGQIEGLGSSISELRRVARSIVTDPQAR